MSIAFAPSPWPAPRGLRSGAPWRFAREWTTPGSTPTVQWRFARGGSFAPRHLLAAYVLLCAVSLGVGVAFWWAGAPAVLPFAGAELLLLGTAFWIGSRHAADTETITLAARELRVEHSCGRRTEHTTFRAEWVRVEPHHGEHSLVELSGQGQRTRVGRYLRPEWRTALAQELRAALKRESLRPAWQDMQEESQR